MLGKLAALAACLTILYILVWTKVQPGGDSGGNPTPPRAIVISEFCEGDYCKNSCDRINATTMKSGGINDSNIDAVDPTNPDNQFAAHNCDPGNKLLLYNSLLCGGDGESTCESSDCCVPKTCENDISPFTVSDKLGYLTDKGIAGVLTVGDVDAVNSLYDIQDRAPLDSKCPYQHTVKLNTPCMGTVGIGMDCTRDATDDCCVPKTCSTYWSDAGDWQGGIGSGMGLECPSNSDFSQKNGSEACDTCGQTECCFQQSDFCIVPIGVIKSGNNTNINNVLLPADMDPDGRFHEDNNPNLAKSLIIGTGGEENAQNIQNIYAGVTGQVEDESYGIMCNVGYMYGKCDPTDGSVTQETCNAHDNNQRGCEGEAGCSFVNGNRPRIDFSGCEIGDRAGINTINVGDCVNTCTGDSDLSDGVYNFFTNGIVDQKYLWAKMETDDNYPYSTPGTGTAKQCNNYGASGAIPNYNYQCEGGGGYFSVSDLNNCFSTCAALRGADGGGLSCPDGKTYDGGAAPQGTTYIDFNKDPTEGGCCITETCENFSRGGSIGCQDHEKIADNIQAGQVASRDNCCVPKTCTDFMNDYNTSIAPDGEQTDVNTICTTGNFNEEHLLSSNYKFSDVSESDAQLLTLYRSGAATYDINCCTTQTCDQYYTRNGGSEPSCPAGQAYVSSTIIPGSEPVDGNNNTCCVSTNPITCSPTSELQHATPDDLSSMGYSIDPTVTDFNAATRFSELSFGLESVIGVGDTETNVWSTSETAPLDGITCSPTFTGTPTLECQTQADGTGHYYLKGCSPVPVVAGTGDGGTGDGTSSCALMRTDDDLLCGLPVGRFNAGIETNALVFTDGAVIHMNSLAGQLDKFQCNESTEMPCFQSCPTSFTPMSISGCHYKDKPTTDGHMFYPDRYFPLDSADSVDSAASADRTGSDCGDLYETDETGETGETGPRGGTGDTSDELAAAKNEIMTNDPSLNDVTALTKMKGNVKHFTCRCDAQSGGNECEHTDREMRFKYVFNEDMDYYNGNNGHISNAAATGGQAPVTYPKGDILNDSKTTICDDGYYPFRGVHFDYCKPCDNYYKENHPISGIATSFCNNGSLGTTGSSIVVPIPNPDQNTDYGNVYNSYTDSAGFTSMSNTGDANIYSGPYGIPAPPSDDDAYERNNNPYNPYYDLSPEAALGSPEVADNFTFGTRMDSQVIEILDFGAIAAAATADPTLSNAVQWWEEYLQSFRITRAGVADDAGAGTGAVALTPQDITRDDLINQDRLLVNDEGIRNVCNSNPNSSREYIPSFPTGSLTGTCEECNNNISNLHLINENLKYTTPFHSGATNIIRNIDNTVAIPICSAEANIFNDSYNQGNIIDFRRATDGSPCGDLLDDNGADRANCCVTGFQYINSTTDRNKCFPVDISGPDGDDPEIFNVDRARLVNDCTYEVYQEVCNRSMQSITTTSGPEMTLCDWNGTANECTVTNTPPTGRIRPPNPGKPMYIDGNIEIPYSDEREFHYQMRSPGYVSCPATSQVTGIEWGWTSYETDSDRYRGGRTTAPFPITCLTSPDFYAGGGAHSSWSQFDVLQSGGTYGVTRGPTIYDSDATYTHDALPFTVNPEVTWPTSTLPFVAQYEQEYQTTKNAAMGLPTRLIPDDTKLKRTYGGDIVEMDTPPGGSQSDYMFDRTNDPITFITDKYRLVQSYIPIDEDDYSLAEWVARGEAAAAAAAPKPPGFLDGGSLRATKISTVNVDVTRQDTEVHSTCIKRCLDTDDCDLSGLIRAVNPIPRTYSGCNLYKLRLAGPQATPRIILQGWLGDLSLTMTRLRSPWHVTSDEAIDWSDFEVPSNSGTRADEEATAQRDLPGRASATPLRKILFVEASDGEENMETDIVGGAPVGRDWKVGGVYIEQYSTDYNAETSHNKDGTIATAAGTLDQVFGSDGQRQYYKKIGAGSNQDLFLFYANNGTYLIATKLTLMASNGAGYVGFCEANGCSLKQSELGKLISEPDGIIVAHGRSKPITTDIVWTNHLLSHNTSVPRITVQEFHLCNRMQDRVSECIDTSESFIHQVPPPLDNPRSKAGNEAMMHYFWNGPPDGEDRPVFNTYSLGGDPYDNTGRPTVVTVQEEKTEQYQKRLEVWTGDLPSSCTTGNPKPSIPPIGSGTVPISDLSNATDVCTLFPEVYLDAEAGAGETWISMNKITDGGVPPTWVIGDRGESCTAACAGLGEFTCVDPEIYSREDFNSALSTLDGDLSCDPSVDFGRNGEPNLGYPAYSSAIDPTQYPLTGRTAPIAGLRGYWREGGEHFYCGWRSWGDPSDYDCDATAEYIPRSARTASWSLNEAADASLGEIRFCKCQPN